MGEAKRRKKLDPNYGKKRHLTKSQRQELERKKHEYMNEENWRGAAGIMYELGNEIFDKDFKPIKAANKEEFEEIFIKEMTASAEANAGFTEKMKKLER